MKFQVSYSNNILSVMMTGTNDKFSLIMKNADKMPETHLSIPTERTKDVMPIVNTIKDIIRTKLSKRMSYAQRLKKVGTMLEKCSNADTWKKFNNQLIKHKEIAFGCEVSSDIETAETVEA